MKTAFLSASQVIALVFLLLLSGPRPTQAQRPAQAQQPGPARPVALDVAGLRRQLAAPVGASARPGAPVSYRISLPTLRGVQPFVLTETFVVPVSDVAGHRRLRTFVGAAAGAAGQRVALVLTADGLRADLLVGAESASLRPAPSGPGYVLRAEKATTGPCGTPGGMGGAFRPEDFATLPAPFSFGTQVRRLKYAILVTLEYYVANGNTDAAVELAVVAAMNQMSGLYLRDLSLGYELVQPTGSSRYFSAMATATLPGSAAAAPGRLRDSDLGEVGTFINARFVPSTFDLGHCFQNGGGGVAYVGVICNSQYKAEAWSGVGTSGFQGILAHEMGHQHGAYHTFAGDCGGYDESSSLEPGGGATIMAYTDVCGAQSLQDVPGTEADHFNLHSLDQMRNQLLRASCPTTTANANRPPTLSAGPDYVIPRNTPFTLTATGADPDGDALAYTWNQFDYTTNRAALGSIVGTGGLAAIDDPNAPLFRPRPPRASPSRTFPDLRFVLANANRPADRIGEALPNVGRELHFGVTVRDQRAAGGTITTDNVTLTVAPNTGPFALTTQNTAANTSLWIAGQPATVSWSVNGTDQAPIGVSQVRISLSTDGGLTFGTVLAAAVPNSGTARITAPNVATSRARVRVEAVGNVFFDINDTDFPIGPCAPVVSQTLPATDLTAPAGDASLNLPQLAFSTLEYAGPTRIAGTITATDPTSTLTTLSGSNCLRYSNVTYYDTHPFVPTTTATYRIDATNGVVLRLYQGTTFVADDPCQNLLADNVTPAFLSAALTAGQSYTLVVSNFGGTPAASTSYTASFTTTPAGGSAYAPLQSIGYEYQYAVVNTATSAVVRLAPTADLRALGAGTYDVYGLLFQGGYAVAGLQGGSLSSLQAALAGTAPCGQLSRNARRVTITEAPLPVVLTRFTARPVGAANQLSWATASEKDVAYFEAQRSTDGEQFAALGRVTPHNTSAAHDYGLVDTAPPVGLSYYRLLMADTDGSRAYSPVVALRADAPTAPPALEMTAYPNPVPLGATWQVRLHAREAQTVRLLLADAQGRVVLRRTLNLPAGSTLLALPEARQWHGLYLLSAHTATGALRQKVVLE